MCSALLRGDAGHGHAVDAAHPGAPPGHHGLGARAHRGRGGGGARHGLAVQVEPMTSMLKAPGTKRLKLKYDKLLSSVAFNWNLRRYISGAISTLGRAWLRRTTRRRWIGTPARQTRVTVGRCRLTVSKPGLKAPMVSALETIIS